MIGSFLIWLAVILLVTGVVAGVADWLDARCGDDDGWTS